jgi:hypothetical protein
MFAVPRFNLTMKIITIALCVGFVAITLRTRLAVSPSPVASTLPFDPASCSHSSDGKIIVRMVSGLAFALPPDAVTLSLAEPRPQGNGHEPPGCEGNPALITSFTINPDYGLLFDDATSELLAANSVYPIDVIGNNVAAVTHRDNLVLQSEVVAHFGNCGNTSEGLLICYHCRPDVARVQYCAKETQGGASSDGRLVKRAGFNLLDPLNLTGPEHLPWVASCGAETAGGSRFCETNSGLKNGLGLSYRFGRNGLDLNTLRRTDLALRKGVLALLAPEFDEEETR